MSHNCSAYVVNMSLYLSQAKYKSKANSCTGNYFLLISHFTLNPFALRYCSLCFLLLFYFVLPFRVPFCSVFLHVQPLCVFFFLLSLSKCFVFFNFFVNFKSLCDLLSFPMKSTQITNSFEQKKIQLFICFN